MPEFELKFQVPSGRADALAAAVQGEPVHEQRLQARYFDTAEGALAARRVVLRLRKEGEQWVQTAKAPGAQAFERLEHEVPLAPGAAPELDLGRHAGQPVGDCLREALGDDAAPLECYLETDITRLARTVDAGGGSSVEIALDRGELRAQGRVQPVLEIEFELKQGSAGGLVELAGRWCEEHGLWLDPLSKSAAGRRLAQGGAPPPVHAEEPELKVRTGNGFAAALLRAGLEQALANARDVAAGTGSDEHVHQLRVGLRRLRSVLRELGGLGELASLREQAEPALDALFQELGRHRDRATLVPALQREVLAAGGPAIEWRPPLPDLAAAVRAAPVQAAWLQLLAAVNRLEQAPEQGAATLKETRRLVRKRLRKLHARLLADGPAFEQLDETARHKVRKRLKRLRYLAELSQPLYSGRAIEHFVGELKALQDALGRYQDEVVGRELMRERAATDPTAWFAVGWLTGREPLCARQCAKACRRLRKVKVFWD